MVSVVSKDLGAAVTLGIGIGFAFGWFLRGKSKQWPLLSRSAVGDTLDLTDTDSQPCRGENKMVIVVRNDLKMGKGKAAAQCAHGALGAAERAVKTNLGAFQRWKMQGQPKVVVKTDTEDELKSLEASARKCGLVCCSIQDAGRTQIPAGSKTVLAVGPGPANLVDEVTGHLKLY